MAVGALATVAGPVTAGDVAAIGWAGVDQLGWKAGEWYLRGKLAAQTGLLTLLSKIGERELTDGDNDEAQIVQKAQELLDKLQAEGGRVQIDELDDRVMAKLQQLGQTVNPSEEFAVYVTESGQMNLVQASQYGGAPPADAVDWLIHTHFGTGVAPSGNDQVILSALGARSGQFYFSTIIDSQGNSAFFLPWPLEKWLEMQ